MVFLTEDQLVFYQTNGYIVLEQVYSPAECAEMAAAAERAEARIAAQRGTSMGEGWGGEWRDDLIVGADEENSQLLSIHDMQYQDAVFAKVLLDERLTEPCADVVGPNVQLHHVKYHCKPPEVGTPFPVRVQVKISQVDTASQPAAGCLHRLLQLPPPALMLLSLLTVD
jgi:phytanoyl-CoA hydroxylase